MYRKNWISMAILIGIGVLLNVLYFAGLADDFWSGLGTAFIFAAAVRLIRLLKYKKNSEYREKVDVEANDERNKYLAMKAWAWAGYLFVLIAAAAIIVFRIMGKEDLSLLTSMWMCLIVFLYWVCYMVLKRKY
ncbi:MAG: hypothetical protein IJ364_09005 [Oscillospiraceae bacterium]|nr:hypothetical protein [Oscillospiraceae bacterium]